MKGKRLGAAALTLLVFLAGCGDDGGETTNASGSGATGGTTTTAPPEKCTQATVGGNVTMAVYSETRGLDPTVSTGSGATGGTEMSAIYDTVMQWDYKTGAYVPRLAESLTPSADFVTWTLKLKSGIKFGNGDPFNVKAVIASIDRHKDPATKSAHRNNAEYVKSMRAIDDLTMEFTLTSGWADFPYVLTDEPGMVPNPAVITALGAAEFNKAPKGAGVGPYEFGEFKVGESLTLKAKTDYWGGPVCIQELKFVALNSAQASYDSVKAGNIEMAFIDDAKVLAQIRADKADVHSDLVGGQGVLINNGVRNSVTPFTDIKLRQAMLAALDVKALDQRITNGTGLATSALFPEKSIFASGVPGPTYDQAKARQLVNEAKASGFNGNVRILCPATQSDQALAVKTALDAVGFNVTHEIANTSGDLIQKVITDANYDLACWSVQLFEAAPFVKLDRFFRSTSAANRNGYKSTEMDAALDELRLAKDVAATKVAVGKIQTILNQTGSHATIRAGETSIVSAKKLRGLTFNAETMVYFDKAFIKN